ncbi:MAG: hypothetical protein ABEJ99_03670 [Candidatus Nanohaloarchaea archaeon]
MNRKGLTPVIATVLLITIAIGATASAFAFINSMQKQTQDHWKKQLNNQKKEDNADFNIEFVYNSTDNYTLVTIRNTGPSSIPVTKDGQKLFSMYLNGKPVQPGSTGWSYTNSNYRDKDLVYINPQQTLTLNTTKEYPVKGDDMKIKLLGPYSTADSYVCYNSGGNSC